MTPTSVPLALPVSIAAVTLAVAAAVIAIAAAAARAAGRDPARIAGRVALAIAAWLAVTAAATAAGIVRLDLGPQRLLPVPLTAMIVAVLALRTATGRALVAAAPRVAVVAVQSFRVPVELILWGLALAGAIPRALTFEGANFDVVVGLTAIPVALVAWSGTRARPALAIAWHLAGLALLANIVIRAMRAAPPVIATVPLVWLPAFLVPVAAIAHVVGVRQAAAALAARAQASPASRSTR